MPAAIIGSAAPAIASSISCPAAIWTAYSTVKYTDPDYTLTNFHKTETFSSTPPGSFEVQHWYNRSTKLLYWRISIGLPRGAEAGAVLTVDAAPQELNWTNPDNFSQYSVSQFKRFGSYSPDIRDHEWTSDLPTGEISATPEGKITVTFKEPAKPKSGGSIYFTSVPNGGEEAVLRGDVYGLPATLNFVPLECPNKK
ncbi:hypothetical protein ACUH95_00330 [Dermabacteraceae bacterium P13101]